MLKALDSKGEGYASDLLGAMRWLLATSMDGVQQNDQNQTNAQKLQISVLSMSLGFYATSLSTGLGGSLCQVVADLEAAGIVVVAAASKPCSNRTVWSIMLCQSPFFNLLIVLSPCTDQWMQTDAH